MASAAPDSKYALKQHLSTSSKLEKDQHKQIE